MKNNINELTKYFHGKSMDNGWWVDPETGKDLRDSPYINYVVATKLLLIVSEVVEAMEGLRKNKMDDKLPHRLMGEVELADALIRIFDLGGALGYDLGGAVVEKDIYNDIRPDHKLENRSKEGGKSF